MKERRFAAGDTVFNEGDASNEAYIIRSGRIEILKGARGAPIRLAVLGEGDVFGEMGLLDERPRSATARVIDDVVTDAIGQSEFISMLLHEPQQGLDLLRALFERLRTINQMLAETRREAPSSLGRKVPKVTLYPLTDEAEASVPADGVPVTRFPFRIGRRPDDETGEILAFNEVELDDVEPYKVSLNHFALDLGPDGIVVRDRGSRDGTTVNEVSIGSRDLRDMAPLRPGDNEIVAGSATGAPGRPGSPFRFKVVVDAAG